ncbi:MAG: iron-sulfur cluster loop [Gammaproteobacteria bacterium]|nr:iron-sulfur cluster loop [Gammaproteobacteria bacterium]MDD9851627.1 iron-sulfur cluster loop [Gammaproteobacteria bacterium]
MNTKQKQAIVKKLLEIGEKPRDPETGDYMYAGPNNRPANKLVNDLKNNPHAFVIACVLDRQVSAEIAWSAPYKLKQRIGNFEFPTLRAFSQEDWRKHLGPQKDGGVLHRLWKNVMPKCLHSATAVIDKYSDGTGDASRIWSGSLFGKDVVNRFKEIHGVGDKIGNMAVRILVTNHAVKTDNRSIDVSVDVHIERVFCRLGLVEKSSSKSKMKKAIINTARELHPEFPGLIDPPIFHIGRDFCHKRNPDCGKCHMRALCDYAIKRKR